MKKMKLNWDKFRELVILQDVEPVVRWVFEKFPQINSCYLMVAQYWNDEANDAVHGSLVFSEQMVPVIDHLTQSQEYMGIDSDTHDVINIPSIKLIQKYSTGEHNNVPWIDYKYHDLATGKSKWQLTEEEQASAVCFNWDNNYLAIPLFAGWTHKGNQEQDFNEAYSPCLLFQRENGSMTCSWCPRQSESDGQLPEWCGEESKSVDDLALDLLYHLKILIKEKDKDAHPF